jgi:hypothetical protein
LSDRLAGRKRAFGTNAPFGAGPPRGSGGGYDAPPPPAYSTYDQPPALAFRLVSADGRTYPVAIGTTVIGRGDRANLRLPDVGISRRHARLDFDGRNLVITDLGSATGTRVNGQRISAVALNRGDVIEMGTTTLTSRAG